MAEGVSDYPEVTEPGGLLSWGWKSGLSLAGRLRTAETERAGVGGGVGAGFSTQESLLLVYVHCKGTLVIFFN